MFANLKVMMDIAIAKIVNQPAIAKIVNLRPRGLPILTSPYSQRYQEQAGHNACRRTPSIFSICSLPLLSALLYWLPNLSRSRSRPPFRFLYYPPAIRHRSPLFPPCRPQQAGRISVLWGVIYLLQKLPEIEGTLLHNFFDGSCLP